MTKTTEKTKETGKTAGKQAVIKTGGKQYLAAEGEIIKIEKLPKSVVNDKGEVTFDEILMIVDGEKVDLGKPTTGKKVTGQLVEEGRDKKISVIHYKSKSRYFKNNGHRQPFAKVKITKIA
jgi:large subunit ribosomal protein L21